MTLKAPEPTSIPRIAAKARLHYDETRERHVLLYPEGLVALNPTGTEILRLCDGARSVGDIVRDLEGRYSVEGIEAEVKEFLHGLARKGLVTYGE